MASLFIFTLDLRLTDNPAIQAAAKHTKELIPLYIFDEHDPWCAGGAGRWWLHHSLADLQQQISDQGGQLILRRGKTLEAVEAFVAEHNIDSIFFSRAYEPYQTGVQKQIYELAQRRDIDCKRYGGRLLWEPDSIFNKQGTPFKVFTPFYKHTKSAFAVPPIQKRVRAKWSSEKIASDAIADWNLLPSKPDWGQKFHPIWNVSERDGKKILRQLADSGGIRQYHRLRDVPSEEGTSMLSPYLHFGQLSPRQIWHALQNSESKESAEPFLRQLVWREFSHYLLYHWPDLPSKPFLPDFASFPWRSSKKDLHTWQRGRTGYPIVDAGMRQLWETGWMHNRVRMVCASFLTKHLRLPWQQGAAWFWDTLLDADLANNSAGWQWVAGCGADAAPYFRVFNPTLQGEKFDPEGDYVKQWVPELSAMPKKYVHSPWLAPKAVLDEAKIKLGETYPSPMVDHKTAREEALSAYRMIKS